MFGGSEKTRCVSGREHSIVSEAEKWSMGVETCNLKFQHWGEEGRETIWNMLKTDKYSIQNTKVSHTKPTDSILFLT